MFFKVIEYQSEDWRNAVQLREKILREPLGSVFSPEELHEEKNHIQITGFLDKQLIATAVLVPEGEKMKMQRVVVQGDLRNKSIGSKMMVFCEQLAREKGVKWIYCHARNTAVNFYLRNNYQTEGDYFDEDGIPHVKMVKELWSPLIREATINDIDEIQRIRHSVKENILSNPSLVTNEDCRIYLTERGKGWVAVVGDEIVGFAIADLKDNNIWALFMHPDQEQKGIGKQLHDTMLNGYFGTGKTSVWLSTEPATRAEGFYTSQNWRKTGVTSNGEVKFEMTMEEWKTLR